MTVHHLIEDDPQALIEFAQQFLEFQNEDQVCRQNYLYRRVDIYY